MKIEKQDLIILISILIGEILSFGIILNVFFRTLLMLSFTLIVFLFSIYTRKKKEEKLIPEHIIKKIAYEELERKRNDIEIPLNSKIKICSVHYIYEDDLMTGISGIKKVEVDVEINNKKYILSVHPEKGYVMSYKQLSKKENKTKWKKKK